uniref:Uncharacterized protein n=1 Tax=Rhizophora mucronata TaxID=61149 RepID=A0A2P2ILW4_RHIMU
MVGLATHPTNSTGMDFSGISDI